MIQEPSQSAPRLLTAEDSLQELTELLHRAYAPLAERGMRYLASHQDAATTRRRCSQGECWVVERDGRIVATIVLKPPGSCAGAGAACYEDPTIASFGQFAVDPPFQGQGLARMLLDFVERRARDLRASAMVIDTSEHAVELIAMYGRRGYREVDRTKWDVTNYTSVILRKDLGSGG